MFLDAYFITQSEVSVHDPELVQHEDNDERNEAKIP